jgi:hypothetical protein
MARRTNHFAISALALFALVLSARLSMPAQARTLAGKIHIGLRAAHASPVFVEVNDPVKLAAVTNVGTLPGSDHIVIGDWDGTGFSNREAHCHAGAATCAATDRGGEEGTFRFKAAVIGKHGKIVAKSSTIIIDRKPLSLDLQITGGDGNPETGTEHAGTLVTLNGAAPDGAGSVWSRVMFVQRLSGSGDAWIPAGSTPCDALPCEELASGGQVDAPQPVDYAVQALDATGKLVKESNVVTVTFVPWQIDLQINGDPVSGDTVDVGRQEPATITASVQDSLLVGKQQFHLIIVDDSGAPADADVADCTSSPCTYTADPPPPGCGDCTHQYTAVVQNGRYNADNDNWGKLPLTVRWLRTGYQFSDLTLSYTWNRTFQCQVDPNDFSKCTPGPDVTVHDTVSGFVCGDPYKDPWTINVDFSTLSVDQHYHNQYTFDLATELGNPQAEYAGQIAPTPEHILVPYVKLYLRGMPGPDTGGKTPDHMELNLNAESGTVVIPVPGSTSTELLHVSPISQTSTAPVTTKDDCS